MPVIAGTVAGAIISGVGAAGAAATAISIATEVVLTIGLNMALGAVAKLLTGKGARNAGAPAPTVTASGTVQPRQLMYGQEKTGGALVFYELGGDNGKYLYFVVAYAGHQCEAITDAWLDNRHVKASEIGGDGLVTTPWKDAAGNLTGFVAGDGSKLKITTYLGRSDQVADPELVNNIPVWDSTHRGNGVAYRIFRLQYDLNIYPNGATPQGLFSLVKGRRLYDPRQDSTNGGSGTQRASDATTWTWSQNWALAVRDYLSGGSRTYDVAAPDKRLGIGEDDSRIDDTYFAAAANDADDDVTVPLPPLTGLVNWPASGTAIAGVGTLFETELVAGDYIMDPSGTMWHIASITDDASLTLSSIYGGPAVTGAVTQYNSTSGTQTSQKRFTADGQISCGAPHAENLQSLLSGANGLISWGKGKYRLHAGVYDIPTVTIVADDVKDTVEVQTHPQGQDLYNAITGTFFDETNGWQQNTFPLIQDATYQSDDGGVYVKQIQLPVTRSSFRAQRLANVLLQQSRNKTTVTFHGLSPKAMKISEWDTFQVTIPEYGWASQIFRCTNWAFLAASGLVSITARIESASAYADLAFSDYQILAGNLNPSVGMKVPDAPTGLAASSFYQQIVLQVNTGQLPAGATIELWESTSSTPFSSATKISEGHLTTFVVNRADSTTRYYWVRIRDVNGNASDPFPSSAGLGAAAVTAGVLSATVSPSSVSIGGPATSQTTPTVTVTPHGGSGSFTHSWAWLSGGSGLSFTNPNGAATAFSGVGMTQGTVYSGVAQDTITDTVSGATAQVNVPVSIACETTLTVSASPSGLTKNDSSATTQTTAATTATPSGGTAPYSHSWAWISGGANLTINSPTSSSTSVTGSGMTANGSVYSGTMRDTVTDAYGQTAHVDVAVSITCKTSGVSFSATLTSGDDGANDGYSTGDAGDSFGSLSTATDSNGNTVTDLYNFYGGPGAHILTLRITGSGIASSYFTNLVVPGLGTLSAATSSFTPISGGAVWQWNNGATIGSGTVTFS